MHWNGKWGQTLLTAVLTKVRNNLYVSVCFFQGLQQHWWFLAPDSRFRAFSLLVFLMLPIVMLQDSSVRALSRPDTLAHLKPGFLCKKCSFSSHWADHWRQLSPAKTRRKKSAGHIRYIIHVGAGSIWNRRFLRILWEMPQDNHLMRLLWVWRN